MKNLGISGAQKRWIRCVAARREGIHKLLILHDKESGLHKGFDPETAPGPTN